MCDDELKIFTIDKNYLKYLYAIDNRVHNSELYNSNRPYLGIILFRENFKYFVPFSSYKENSNNKKSKEYILKIIDNKDPNDVERLGYLMFNNMIPCIDGVFNEIDISEITNMEYKTLILKQYLILRTDSFKKRINRKAEITFNKFLNGDSHYIRICCDFNLLEEKCNLYTSMDI